MLLKDRRPEGLGKALGTQNRPVGLDRPHVEEAVDDNVPHGGLGFRV